MLPKHNGGVLYKLQKIPTHNFETIKNVPDISPFFEFFEFLGDAVPKYTQIITIKPFLYYIFFIKTIIFQKIHFFEYFRMLKRDKAYSVLTFSNEF